MNTCPDPLASGPLIVLVLILTVALVTPVSADNSQTVIVPNTGKYPIPSPVQDILPVWTFPVSLNDSAYPNDRPLSISDSGDSLASSSDHALSYLDRNGSILWSYQSLSDVRNVIISGDGSTVVTGFWDNSLMVFDRNGTQLRKLQFDNGFSTVAVSEDGRDVVVGEMDQQAPYGGEIVYFDRAGTIFWNYTTPVPIVNIAMSSDGQYVAAGGLGYDLFLSPGENDVFFLDRTGKFLWGDRTLRGNIVAITPDASYIAVASGGKKGISLFSHDGVSQWSSKTDGGATDVLLSSSGDRLSAIINPDQSLANHGPSKILTYDGKGKLLWSCPLTGPGYDVISNLDLSSDGNVTALGTTSGKIVVLDGNGTVIGTFDAGSRIRTLSLSRDGRHLAAITENKLFFFNRSDNETVPTVTRTQTKIQSTELSCKPH